MPPAGYFIDASLLVLLVVGRVDIRLIQKHKRLQEYTEKDFGILLAMLVEAGHIFVTPNTLTETSNLLGQHGEPERSRFFGGLRYLIEHTQEIVVSSKAASSNTDFNRLGLTDAALLEAASADTPVITMDGALYHIAAANDPDSVVNFNYLRGL